MKKIILSLSIILVIIAIVFTGGMFVKGKTYNVKKPIATIQIEGYNQPIKLELDPQSAPNAVSNFIKLANGGFYNNHKMTIETNRIAIQEPDDEEEAKAQKAHLSNIIENPQSDYIYGIKGDFEANGFKNNTIKHRKGVITMVREDYSYFGYAEEGYNSANSTFAILTQDVNGYNKNYASFGYIVEGMDVLDKIAESRVEEKEEDNTAATTEDTTENKAEENKEKEEVNVITIKSITVDTFGVDYGTPEYVNYEENIAKVEAAYNKMYGNYNSSSSATVDADETEDTTSTTDTSTTVENN